MLSLKKRGPSAFPMPLFRPESVLRKGRGYSRGGGIRGKGDNSIGKDRRRHWGDNAGREHPIAMYQIERVLSITSERTS